MLRMWPEIPLELEGTWKWTEAIPSVKCYVPVKENVQPPLREPLGSTVSLLTDHEISKMLSVYS